MRFSQLFNSVAKAIAWALVVIFGAAVMIVVISIVSVVWAISPLMGMVMLAAVLILIRLIVY